MKIKQVYECGVCGNIVELLRAGGGQLVCCGQPMNLLNEKSQEEGREKHLPVIEKTENGVRVKIGEIAHPMEDSHHIEWIEIVAGDSSQRKFLNPGKLPEAVYGGIAGENVSVRAYCNIHGLWKK